MSVSLIMYRNIDLVYTIFVKIESPNVDPNVVTAMFPYTDDRWKTLKVMCGIFIIVVLIIALIAMLWRLPGNGKPWLIDFITALCSICHHIMLVPIDWHSVDF